MKSLLVLLLLKSQELDVIVGIPASENNGID
jgi:hypothetical protein